MEIPYVDQKNSATKVLFRMFSYPLTLTVRRTCRVSIFSLFTLRSEHEVLTHTGNFKMALLVVLEMGSLSVLFGRKNETSMFVRYVLRLSKGLS